VSGVVERKVALTWCEVQIYLHRADVSSRQSYDEPQVGATPAILKYVSVDYCHLELSVRDSVQAARLECLVREERSHTPAITAAVSHSFRSLCSTAAVQYGCCLLRYANGCWSDWPAQTKGWTLPSFRFLGFGLRSTRSAKVKRKIAVRASSLPYLAHRLQASFIIAPPMPWQRFSGVELLFLLYN
jgi:hypothetical protein